VRDVFGERMFSADGTGVDGGGGTGFAECVVAAVEVLAFFEVFSKVVGFGGQLSVETEKTLLVGREGADVDLVPLMRIHFDVGCEVCMIMEVKVDRPR